MSPLRICLIASSRFPIAEPFAGGLEAHTGTLAQSLTRRGHHVTLFAGPGSAPMLGLETLPVEEFTPSASARADVSSPPEQWMAEHHAYLQLMLALSRDGAQRFDVVHNNSLHHLPVAMAGALPIPLVTTLHTPPTAWLESAIRLAPSQARFAAVSRYTARQWRHAVDAEVIANGVDIDRWTPGPGGDAAVWFGRIVPEKAPHLAIDAARIAGIPLRLAGPLFDTDYYRAEIAPRLGADIRYLGHLPTTALAELVGASAVTVITPRWDEPFGLVAAESMACGTPVAAFARGGLPEQIAPCAGRLCPPDDTAALADAMTQAALLDRTRTRSHAVDRVSLEAMVTGYEGLYRRSLRLAA